MGGLEVVIQSLEDLGLRGLNLRGWRLDILDLKDPGPRDLDLRS